MYRDKRHCCAMFAALAAALMLAGPALAQEDADHGPAEQAAGADDHTDTAGHAEPGHEEDGHAADGHAAGNTNPLSIDVDLAICTLIVFVVLFLVLYKFAWGPISEGLDKREGSIADMIEQARQSQEKAAEQLKVYEARLAAAAEEAKAIVAQAHQDGEAAAARIGAEAQQNAQRMSDRAKADIETAKNAALAELAQRSVDTAVALAGRLVHREIRADDHAALVKDALDKFPSKN